jgi:hypothetical protein
MRNELSLLLPRSIAGRGGNRQAPVLSGSGKEFVSFSRESRREACSRAIVAL